MTRGVLSLLLLSACFDSGVLTPDAAVDGSASQDGSFADAVSDAALDLLTIAQHCADGQTSTAGWIGQPESLLSPEVFGQSYVMAVLARRISDREPGQPFRWVSSGDLIPTSCREQAIHEVVDGLGWTDEQMLEIRAYTGQYYTARADGSWHPTQQWMESFFDPEWQSLPSDDEVYLFVLIIDQPTDNMIVKRRIALVPDESGELVLSGEYTLRGDNVSIEEFRAP